ncbi:MAG TPA: KilA-N domain-containing protein [Candidatus Obscuribacterales bacterium]
MSNLIFHAANDLPIGQRRGDGYLSATALCKAAGKKWNDYYRLDSTKEYLEALSENLNLKVIVNNAVAGIPASALVETFKGGNSQQGTWVHPQVAVHLAMWLSPEFAVQVTQWVVQWMSGTAQPQPTESEPAQLKAWTPPELYPQMTQAEFETIPVENQWLYLESPQERRQRQRQELREISYWTSRCYRGGL